MHGVVENILMALIIKYLTTLEVKNWLPIPPQNDFWDLSLKLSILAKALLSMIARSPGDDNKNNNDEMTKRRNQTLKLRNE